MQEFYDKGDGPSQSKVNDPLTRPAPAEKTPAAGHPLPQGGEGYPLSNRRGLQEQTTDHGPLTMDNGHKPIGVLAIQGDFAMHAKMLERLGRAL